MTIFKYISWIITALLGVAAWKWRFTVDHPTNRNKKVLTEAGRIGFALLVAASLSALVSTVWDEHNAYRTREDKRKQDGVTGRTYATLAEAREAAGTSQEALVAFVNGLSEASNTEETFDHFLFGPLNCRQWAVFQRVHDGDHGNQIEKIKAADGFPSN